MPTFPKWWNWDLSFTGHAQLPMEQRGVTEVEVRAMLERATGFEASVVEGRFMVQTRRGQSSWIVIVEPDAEATLLNQLLAELGELPLAEQDYRPARAA